MADRIETTHVGSLPRPQKLLEFSQKRTLGEKFDETAFGNELKKTSNGHAGARTGEEKWE